MTKHSFLFTQKINFLNFCFLDTNDLNWFLSTSFNISRKSTWSNSLSLIINSNVRIKSFEHGCILGSKFLENCVSQKNKITKLVLKTGIWEVLSKIFKISVREKCWKNKFLNITLTVFAPK